MGKPSSDEMNRHDRAQALINSDKELTHDDRVFVLENWLPFARGRADINAAFFTPWPMAQWVAYNSGSSGRFVDICAGIGALSYALICQGWGGRPDWSEIDEIVCVELSTEYVEIGQRLFPFFNWVNDDVFDLDLWRGLGEFTHAVSNPPFGKPRANRSKQKMADWLTYQGSNELMIAEIGVRVANSSMVMILPQTAVPHIYQRSSGSQRHQTWDPSSKTYLNDYGASGECQKFIEAHDHNVVFGGGSCDTEEWRPLWKGASPVTEVASVWWEEHKNPIPKPGLPEMAPVQASLFAF